MATGLEPASEDRLVAAADTLERLAAGSGLGNLRLAGDGQLIATVEAGRTLLDITRFEVDAAAELGASVSVISAGAPLALQIDRGPFHGGCAHCGATRTVTATVTLQGVSVEVPMEECPACGTRWIDEGTALWLDNQTR